MPNLFLNPDARFAYKVSNFPDTLYRVNDPTSKIFRLLYALLEIGIGQAKGMQDMAIMAESNLSSTVGQELDQYFEMFGLRRPKEFSGHSVEEADDAKFRTTISKSLQALSLGGTAVGMKLMAEASTGFKCNVVEPWRNPEVAIFEARLLDEASNPVGNEVIISIYPDRVLTEDEENTIRVRVITNCKIIAPLHTSITVKIEDLGQSAEYVPSSVSSDSFSYVEEAPYPELYSQEIEISLNDAVSRITTYEITSDFISPVGSISQSIDDTTQTLLVQEDVAPSTSSFFAKLEEGTDSEIVFVKDRAFFEEPNIFLYQIERGQEGTGATEFNDGAKVSSNIVEIYAKTGTIQGVVENWRPIPLADSSDNYPSGKYPNDPTKYDAKGNYLFEWSSQLEFLPWFTNYVTKSGGEVRNGQYRMGITSATQQTANESSSLTAKILGPSFNLPRPIPRPRKQ